MKDDPLAAAISRAAEIKESLLREAGGVWTLAEVSRHLGTSLPATERRLAQGSLLAVQIRETACFPRCQFTEAGAPVGLGEVLRAIDTDSAWVKLSVLLSPTLRRDADAEEDDKEEKLTVIDALKLGHRAEALHAARSWGAQGGS